MQPAWATSSNSTGKWSALAAARPQGAGLEILLLGEDGRIKTDYQFIES
jgi:hypothetical protein